jgi:hypothetical protein
MQYLLGLYMWDTSCGSLLSECVHWFTGANFVDDFGVAEVAAVPSWGCKRYVIAESFL